MGYDTTPRQQIPLNEMVKRVLFPFSGGSVMSLNSVSSSNPDPAQISDVHTVVQIVAKSSPHKRSYRWWARRIALSSLALFLVLVLSTLFLGAKAKADLIAKYP